MQKFVGNRETLHFANWVLYSGEVDLEALIEGATDEGDEWLVGDWRQGNFNAHDGFDLIYGLSKELETLLTDELTTLGRSAPWLQQFGEECNFNSPEAFRGGQESLFAPMLYWAAYGVNYVLAARIILEHAPVNN